MALALAPRITTPSPIPSRSSAMARILVSIARRLGSYGLLTICR